MDFSCHGDEALKETGALGGFFLSGFGREALNYGNQATYFEKFLVMFSSGYTTPIPSSIGIITKPLRIL